MTPELGVVGINEWGKNLARCFRDLGALGCVCDSNRQRLEDARQLFPDVRSTTSFTQLLADRSITRVALAVPASQHFELARAALQAGKDVLVEKPLCLRSAEARDLVQLAASSERVLMVGHVLRYHACVRRLEELVSSGQIGDLLTINSQRLSCGRVRETESVLWSLGPHDISLILALAGAMPREVHATATCHLRPGRADAASCTLEFESGLLAQAHVSWLHPHKEQKLTVIGSKATAVFDDTQPWANKLRLYRGYLATLDGVGHRSLEPAGEAIGVLEREPLAAECEHFLEACLRRTTPKTDGLEGARVVEVLERAEHSIARGSAARPAAAQCFLHPSAVVETLEVGRGTKIWHFSHVMPGARIGSNVVLGQNVFVAASAVVGDGVRVQNNVSIYDGVELDPEVFVGPSVVFTNVKYPRAEIRRRDQPARTVVRRGATIGANATIVCGVTLGRHCFVAAGSVVTDDVADYALVVGNPARQSGFVGRHGVPLRARGDAEYECPESGLRYRELERGKLRCLELDEDEPLSRLACVSST